MFNNLGNCKYIGSNFQKELSKLIYYKIKVLILLEMKLLTIKEFMSTLPAKIYLWFSSYFTNGICKNISELFEPSMAAFETAIKICNE